jgi:hypothetical protein
LAAERGNPPRNTSTLVHVARSLCFAKVFRFEVGFSRYMSRRSYSKFKRFFSLRFFI